MAWGGVKREAPRTLVQFCCVVKVKESESGLIGSNSLWPHGLYSLWKSPGQNNGVDSLSLLQGIFPTQGSNPGVPYRRQILYQLSHQGNPRILEWVDYPISRGLPWPRNRTRVSCIAGRFFTNWAIREAHISLKWKWKVKVKSLSRVQLFATPWTVESMEFSRLEYWSGSLSLLLELVPTQGLNPGVPHCRWILYHLSHQGSPNRH